MITRLLISVTAAALLAGCVTNPGGGPPPNGYSVFYSQADHLKELVAKGRFDEAVRLHGQQGAYFREREDKLAPLLDEAAKGYNGAWQPKIDEAIARCSAVAWPSPRERWAEIRASLAHCRKTLAEYGGNSLTVGPRQAEGVGALRQVTDGAVQRIQADAAALLKIEDVASGRNFLSDYPLDLSLTGALAERLKAAFEAKPDEEAVFRAASAYAAQAKSDKAVNAEFVREVGELLRLRARTGTLKQVAALYKRARSASVAPASIPVSVAVHSTSIDAAQFPISVERDLPFDWRTAATLNPPPDADFVVAAGPVRASLDRKVGDYAQVQSRYLAGYQSVPNPAYQAALLDLQRAQQIMANARSQQVAASNDITCNAYGCQQNPWSQLGATFGMIGARETFDKAQAQVASTPQTLQQPVYQPYSYDTAVISTSKKVDFAAFVGRPKGGATEAYTQSASESQQFKVAYKVHEKEAGSTSQYASEGSVDAWEKKAVAVGLSALLAEGDEKRQPVSWQQASAAFDRKAFTTNATRPQGPAVKGAAVKGDPRFGSVVVVKAADSLGSGFYVSADTIVTNAHVVDGQTFVTMKTYEGVDINGKVVASDKRRDLALVRTQSAGIPAKLSGKEIAVGSQVEVVGHPQGLQYTLTRGIVSQVRTMPPASGIGGGLVSYVQLDASISPGNSGGPVFLDGAVIGVATWKVASKGAEGLNFAVHREEVASFLRENGISP